MTDDADEDEGPRLPPGARALMTPAGHARMRAEWHHLMKMERPKIVDIVSWAAGNGDRSENGDYLYGKTRLREIDKRARFLGKRLENAEVVDPAAQQNRDRVFFGATVTFVNDEDVERTVTIVGADEADLARGEVSLYSPIARALLRAKALRRGSISREFTRVYRIMLTSAKLAIGDPDPPAEARPGAD